PIAERFYSQWLKLVKAGDDMPDALKHDNAQWTTDGPVSVAFAATPDEDEFEPVEELIRNAQDGLFFLMFMPGQSPLLNALLDGRKGKPAQYVRGVVSKAGEKKKGTIIERGPGVIGPGEEKIFCDSPFLPGGAPGNNFPPGAGKDSTRRMFFPAGL